MVSTWMWLWFGFMFLFLLPPLGYGWGYRGWGPPIPSYVQRRRERAAAEGSSVNHRAWGWGGDFVWIALVVGVCWMATGMWWS
jgi:hypothetical protein